jgi:uncharacterized beta-barrel protein YwiB (DUF1934 family)
VGSELEISLSYRKSHNSYFQYAERLVDPFASAMQKKQSVMIVIIRSGSSFLIIILPGSYFASVK